MNTIDIGNCILGFENIEVEKFLECLQIRHVCDGWKIGIVKTEIFKSVINNLMFKNNIDEMKLLNIVIFMCDKLCYSMIDFNNFKSVLSLACRLGYLDAVKYCFENKLFKNSIFSHGYIIRACFENKHINIIKYLYENIFVNNNENIDKQLCEIACQEKCLEGVKFLFEEIGLCDIKYWNYFLNIGDGHVISLFHSNDLGWYFYLEDKFKK